MNEIKSSINAIYDHQELPEQLLADLQLAGYINFTGELKLPILSPVNAVKASQVLLSDENLSIDSDVFTIDTKSYTWKSVLTPLEGEILIGASVIETLTNAKNAINHTGTPNVDYSCALAHPTVIAEDLNNVSIKIVAKVAGDAGNDIVTTSSTGSMDFLGSTLINGLDGTPGYNGFICFDGNDIWKCIEDDYTITNEIGRAHV
jgi:hypothetical protein